MILPNHVEVQPNLWTCVTRPAGTIRVRISGTATIGIGYSLHAGQVIVADGTPEAAKRIERVLTTDPGMGVIRHADAGYEEAVEFAVKNGVDIPILRARD